MGKGWLSPKLNPSREPFLLPLILLEVDLAVDKRNTGVGNENAVVVWDTMGGAIGVRRTIDRWDWGDLDPNSPGIKCPVLSMGRGTTLVRTCTTGIKAYSAIQTVVAGERVSHHLDPSLSIVQPQTTETCFLRTPAV